MRVVIEPKFVMQDEQVARFYEARDQATGDRATGASHFQALLNLLNSKTTPIYG